MSEMRSSSTEWDQFGEREPYFAVLTDERFLRDRVDIDEFYATGEADVARLFADIGEPFDPRSALDFGCGVGRLTRALVQRVPEVVGCDAAESMLRLAREAVPGATFTTGLPDRRFDLVCSLIVFQHIPVTAGMAIVDRLLGMVGAGGVAALHFTFRRPGGALRRFARQVRARVPLVHRIASRIEGDRRGLPYMQMNEYDLEAIRARLRDAGFREPRLVPTNHGGIEGAIVIARKG
jgi:ubiquinone/menaquinone biosynthesis C-methylase UbiE